MTVEQVRLPLRGISVQPAAWRDAGKAPSVRSKLGQLFVSTPSLSREGVYVYCRDLPAFGVFLRPPANDTPSLDACWYVAPTVRFSFRAIAVVFTFSRASALS